ncbi:MAG TPA: TonB family protein [Candidatus Rubrimentiphilum sp.]|nr:TonB family protein [Candidatus Rubrimentiphilum sp.]
MDGKRNRRVLAAALAVSLAVHAVLATFVHVRFVEAKPYQIPTVITHIWVRPKLTPPPKPHTVAFAHHPVQIVRPQIQRPHVAPNLHGVVAIASPGATGVPTAPGNTGTPGGVIGQPDIPVGPPAPACSDPNVDAKTIVAISPDAPASAYGGATDVTAMIKVDLDASGRILGVSVYRSAGSLELDQAAMQAARQSTYSPEVRDCQAVPGSYLFKVEFSQ